MRGPLLTREPQGPQPTGGPEPSPIIGAEDQPGGGSRTAASPAARCGLAPGCARMVSFFQQTAPQPHHPGLTQKGTCGPQFPLMRMRRDAIKMLLGAGRVPWGPKRATDPLRLRGARTALQAPPPSRGAQMTGCPRRYGTNGWVPVTTFREKQVLFSLCLCPVCHTQTPTGSVSCGACATAEALTALPSRSSTGSGQGQRQVRDTRPRREEGARRHAW